jgi:hypothetical protein
MENVCVLAALWVRSMIGYHSVRFFLADAAMDKRPSREYLLMFAGSLR